MTSLLERFALSQPLQVSFLIILDQLGIPWIRPAHRVGGRIKVQTVASSPRHANSCLSVVPERSICTTLRQETRIGSKLSQTSLTGRC